MNASPLKQPSALIPLAMSLAALTMVLVHYALYGIVPEADEGTPAHIFQLLMVIQAPIVVFFAAKWLPLAPARAIQVILLQFAAALSAIVAVLLLT